MWDRLWWCLDVTAHRGRNKGYKDETLLFFFTYGRVPIRGLFMLMRIYLKMSMYYLPVKTTYTIQVNLVPEQGFSCVLYMSTH